MRWKASHVVLVGLVISASILGSVSDAALAQAYPSKPIRFISPFPAGSVAEVLGRVVGQKLHERWGQPVVVETKAGAGGSIGADFVAKSAPDGYTLVVGSSAEITVGVSMYANLPYDPVKDLAPVILIGPVANAILVHSAVPATSVAELIALAKSKPGQLNFGSSGNGTTGHLSGEMLKQQAGIDMIHVAYRGSPPAVADLLVGRIALMFGPLTTALPHIKSGAVRAIAVGNSRRFSAAPDVPTMMESGFPEFEASLWFGLLARAGTPADIVTKFNLEVGRILQLPDVRDVLLKLGAEPVGGTPEEFGELIRTDIAKWAKVAKASGARIN